MPNEHGEWNMCGVSFHDPNCLKTVDMVSEYVNQVGFLPLFKNEIPGFSVEERTVPNYWWSGDREHDPWEWRAIIAARGEIAYGKFYDNKAGFISKEWFPVFANMRRDGYDFDARYEDQLAKNRCKKIMDLFLEQEELFSFEMKTKAGFGKGKEKNFDGTISELQMQTYLVARDFRQRTNKKGEPYGWAVAVYTTPEHLWGRDVIAAGYREKPSDSKEKIRHQIKSFCPEATEKQILRIIK